MYARVKQTSQGLEYHSSFDRGLVVALKSQIPAAMRRWNPDKKCWIVDNSQLALLEDLTRDYLGVTLQVPVGTSSKANNTSATRLLRVEYIGQIKDRGNGDMSAMGAKDNEPISYTHIFDGNMNYQGVKQNLEWIYVFPESVLKKWFTGNDEKTPNMATYYTALATRQNATQKEIKTAWRKMLMRYHPDKNSDEDAAQMTIKINEAYNILRNPAKRKKYDAGLKLQMSLGTRAKPLRDSDFTIPIRCGMIMAKGHDRVGRFVVDEILEWSDIVENGRSLVTSWDLSTNSLRREWV